MSYNCCECDRSWTPQQCCLPRLWLGSLLDFPILRLCYFACDTFLMTHFCCLVTSVVNGIVTNTPLLLFFLSSLRGWYFLDDPLLLLVCINWELNRLWMSRSCLNTMILIVFVVGFPIILIFDYLYCDYDPFWILHYCCWDASIGSVIVPEYWLRQLYMRPFQEVLLFHFRLLWVWELIWM